MFGWLVEMFEKRASEPACGEECKRKSAGQARKGDATRPKHNKNGECWGLYLAAEGFVVAASFVLPVLLIVMEVMEKALLLSVTMAMVIWMHGE